MRIAPEHIQEKALAGKTSAGHPVLYVLTKGGLHAFFVKGADGIEAAGAAPHRAVAEWIAEKKYPGIEWDEKFVKNQGLEKSERAAFDRVRNLMFRPEIIENSDHDPDMYFVYDPKNVTIDVMSSDEVRQSFKKHEWSFIRPVNLSAPVDVVKYAVKNAW